MIKALPMFQVFEDYYLENLLVYVKFCSANFELFLIQSLLRKL